MRRAMSRIDEFRPLLGNRIYGCGRLPVRFCPWNKFAKQARETALAPRSALDAPLLAELYGWTYRIPPPLCRHGREALAGDRFLRMSPMPLATAAVRERRCGIEKLLPRPFTFGARRGSVGAVASRASTRSWNGSE